jgi:hypothetical protein
MRRGTRAIENVMSSQPHSVWGSGPQIECFPTECFPTVHLPRINERLSWLIFGLPRSLWLTAFRRNVSTARLLTVIDVPTVIRPMSGQIT